MKPESNVIRLRVSDAGRGMRLDRWLAAECPQVSRARLQQLIESGLAQLNGAAAKVSQKLRGGETVEIELRPRPALRAEPEAIPIEIVYEDADILIVNKPAGMAVHAGAGNTRGTLVNALLGRGQALSRGGSDEQQPLRPGIVHRLDKDTSGLLVIAKNDSAHEKLAESFRSRQVEKIYLALVQGKLGKDRGKVDLAIGRDPVHRTRMKAHEAPPRSAKGSLSGSANIRDALTEWRRIADYGGAELLEVQLHTGRTHQIRVHFSALKHPLVGDRLYGGLAELAIGKKKLSAPARQFLHAAKLGFPHPRTGEWMEARAPLAQDLREFLSRLAEETGLKSRVPAQYL